MTTFSELDEKLQRLARVSERIEEEGLTGKITNQMRNTAVAMINLHHAVDTGALRSSVEGASDIIVREDDVTLNIGIQTRMEYAKYIEFGTGTKGSAEFSSALTGQNYVSDGVTFKNKAFWYQRNPDYQGEPGKNNDPRRVITFGGVTSEVNSRYNEFIKRYAQPPRPFMRPALYDNIPYFKKILKETLSEDFA